MMRRNHGFDVYGWQENNYLEKFNEILLKLFMFENAKIDIRF